MKNYYKVLHIPQNATAAEIEKAYQKLAQQYDPAKQKGDKYAEERFIDVSVAYKTLTDASKREDYDRILYSVMKDATWKRGNVTTVESAPRHSINFKWVAVIAVVIVAIAGFFWMNNRLDKEAVSITDTAVMQQDTVAPVQTVPAVVTKDTAENHASNRADSVAEMKPVVVEKVLPKQQQPEVAKKNTKESKATSPKIGEMQIEEKPLPMSEYYALGASKSDILNIQGTPTAIAKYNNGTIVWFYGKSELHLVNGKLDAAKNIDGNLKLK